MESDNFSEDPHADLKMSKKAPKFEEAMDANGMVMPVSDNKGINQRILPSFIYLFKE